jgi:alkanesulfonate monooxygenase SsuD/methylene tetrahydromethanopterin reductase-like flavin-dependent oxidoreductase (luciferase family)/predicted lipid carrier protein YhbT
LRFGLFYEHQRPRTGEGPDEERLLAEALEQVELADRLGIDYVWEVEHHFLEEYSHSSAPEVFLAAASQRTQRIRLGHGVVQLPPAVNHPARVAERVATLDLVSGGRVDLGTGESSSQLELGGFGVEREEKRAQWQEALDAITRMFVEEPFAGSDGRYVSMPPRNVVPKPRQRPHPPLWVACSRRETTRLAAERGLGALSFSFVDPEQAKEWVDSYYELIASDRCVPAGFAVNPSFAVVLPFMCHADEGTAIERGIEGAHFFGFSLAYYYAFGEHRPGRSNVWRAFQERRDEVGFAREIVTPDRAPLGVKLLQEGFGSLRGAIGTPNQVAELIERYEAAGVDQVIFVSQAGPNRHEHICESLELFASEVLPRFAERAEDRERAKRERLAEPIARALARRAPAREADSAYLVRPDGEPAPARVPMISADGARRGIPSRRELVSRAGESALAAVVRGRSDAQLHRLFDRGPGLDVIFRGMKAAFVPERAMGFEGDVQYELRTRDGVRRWVVSIGDGSVRVRRGSSAEPNLLLRIDIPDFVRLAGRQAYAPRLLLQGAIEIEGDIRLAGRLDEMFGGQPAT